MRYWLLIIFNENNNNNIVQIDEKYFNPGPESPISATFVP